MQLPYYLFDVFTDQPFGGNPLAVVPHTDDLSIPVMQAIAREFNLSETVILQTPGSSDHFARLRIFTPLRELPMAGHPTIGAIYYFLECTDLLIGQTAITVEEGVGPLRIEIDRDGSSVEKVMMEQPSPQFGGTIAHDTHSRMFAPLLGVPEDPATGSAHGPLGSYCVKYGLLPAGEFTGEQGYEMGRYSQLIMRIEEKSEGYAVQVGGRSRLAGEGKLYI